MKKPSGLWEWYSPPWPTDIVGVRTVRPPTLNVPPLRYLNLAASFTSCRTSSDRMQMVDSETTYLVEGGEDIIRKLDFRDGCLTHRGDTDAESSNALLR